MSTPTRPTTKSALAVARQALDAARAALPAYSSKYAKKTYTQHQRVAALAVRQFLRVDYRGPSSTSRTGPTSGPRSGSATTSPTTRPSRRRPTGGQK